MAVYVPGLTGWSPYHTIGKSSWSYMLTHTACMHSVHRKIEVLKWRCWANKILPALGQSWVRFAVSWPMRYQYVISWTMLPSWLPGKHVVVNWYRANTVCWKPFLILAPVNCITIVAICSPNSVKSLHSTCPGLAITLLITTKPTPVCSISYPPTKELNSIFPALVNL